MTYLNWINTATDRTRDGARQAAGWMEAGVAPLNYLLDKALRLSNIAHTSVNKMIERQHNFVVGSVEAGAKRLKIAADSEGVRDLVQDQVALFPETRDRLTNEFKQTWGIVTHTRDELRGAFAPTAKKAKSAKKTTRKTAPKTTTAAKTKADDAAK